jgi:O-acetyl-ADP-ribose deacetylase (regulator of RNase III)
MAITYLTGDATSPKGDGPHVIIHINNNFGAWGAGFVMSLSQKWPYPELRYKDGIDDGRLLLGIVQLVQVEENIYVANMVAQDGFPTEERPVAVDYEALTLCLRKLGKHLPTSYQIHGPRIGTGIGGGDWDTIAEIIERELPDHDVKIYTLPGSRFLEEIE